MDEFDPENASDEERIAYDYKERSLYAINVLRVAHAIVMILQAASYSLNNYNPTVKEQVEIKKMELEVTGEKIKPK